MTQQRCHESLDSDELSSEPQRIMFRYWEDACAGLSVPPKIALDPVRFPRDALPALSVVQPIDEGDFRIRIVGTGVRNAIGMDYTGMVISAVPEAESIRTRLIKCCETLCPTLMAGSVRGHSVQHKFYTVLLLPFGTTADVERIVLVFHFTHHPPRLLEAHPPILTCVSQ